MSINPDIYKQLTVIVRREDLEILEKHFPRTVYPTSCVVRIAVERLAAECEQKEKCT